MTPVIPDLSRCEFGPPFYGRAEKEIRLGGPPNTDPHEGIWKTTGMSMVLSNWVITPI